MIIEPAARVTIAAVGPRITVCSKCEGSYASWICRSYSPPDSRTALPMAGRFRFDGGVRWKTEEFMQRRRRTYKIFQSDE